MLAKSHKVGEVYYHLTWFNRFPIPRFRTEVPGKKHLTIRPCLQLDSAPLRLSSSMSSCPEEEGRIVGTRAGWGIDKWYPVLRIRPLQSHRLRRHLGKAQIGNCATSPTRGVRGVEGGHSHLGTAQLFICSSLVVSFLLGSQLSPSQLSAVNVVPDVHAPTCRLPWSHPEKHSSRLRSFRLAKRQAESNYS